MNPHLLIVILGLFYILIFGGMSLLRREGLSTQFAVEALLITALVEVIALLTNTAVDPILFLIFIYLVTMRGRLLVDLANFLPRVKNFNVAVTEEKGKVVFLRKIVPGGADKSYGIHVAQLAGLPSSVIHRAQEVLAGLESSQPGQRDKKRTGISSKAVLSQQLPLFANSHNLADEIINIDVNSMSPLEAITRLYELKKKAEELKTDRH